MEDHADILQQRIEVPAIDGIQRQRAGEGVRGEQNKQQKAEGIIIPITASTLDNGVEREGGGSAAPPQRSRRSSAQHLQQR